MILVLHVGLDHVSHVTSQIVSQVTEVSKFSVGPLNAVLLKYTTEDCKVACILETFTYVIRRFAHPVLILQHVLVHELY